MFQSTRPRGARRNPGSQPETPLGGFNPRARVGRDFCPPSSATRRSMFQSTRPRGARRVSHDSLACSISVSIHAPAWGATALKNRAKEIISGFNPRARVGRDQQVKFINRLIQGFQSTRPRGARRFIRQVFIVHGTVSIHAPAWGATQMAAIGRDFMQFQSTRPRGARPICSVEYGEIVDVSIHAPAWGAT